MICGLVVGKIYKYEFRLYLQNLSRICKMGITFAYELGLKSFLYEKSSTRKVTYDLNQGNLVQHLQNPQKPNRTKDTGLLRSRGGKMKKKFKHTSGALCATSNRKKNWFQKNFFLKFFQNMIRNMTGSLKYFFKISSHSWTWTKS